MTVSDTKMSDFPAWARVKQVHEQGVLFEPNHLPDSLNQLFVDLCSVVVHQGSVINELVFSAAKIKNEIMQNKAEMVKMNVSLTEVSGAQALVRREDLSFSYRKSPDAAAEERLVRPEGLRHEDGSWYLDALDLGRRARRTFRLDRMEGARGVAARGPLARAEAEAGGGREVRISFSDPSYLDLLPWHDLRVERTADGVQGVTPYYGGMWLPRMLAACGGTATTDDAEVAALARSYARGQLGRDVR